MGMPKLCIQYTINQDGEAPDSQRAKNQVPIEAEQDPNPRPNPSNKNQMRAKDSNPSPSESKSENQKAKSTAGIATEIAFPSVPHAQYTKTGQ
jgi:hypothetical protein